MKVKSETIARVLRNLADRIDGPLHDETMTALRTARELIIRHHDATVIQHAGCFCPVCHRPDGSEPEIDQIHAALRKAPVTK